MNRRWMTWILICIMMVSVMAESALAADLSAVTAADEEEPIPTEIVDASPAPTDEPETSPEPTATPEPSPVPLAGLALAESEMTIRAAETRALELTLSPENVYPLPEVRWTSSDSSVAKVDNDGVVTGVGLGRAVIQAEAEG